MKVYYSDTYTIPLPKEHRFPIAKYRLLRDYLINQKILSPQDLFKSTPVTENELLLAHSADYIDQMKNGTVPHAHMKRVGFPWSEELYLRSCATVGGTVGACLAALKEGIAGNLAGGTHHAHFDRGEGYCVFNDIAIATRMLHRENLAEKIAIIDLDVHQGNGNSSILINDPNVFILSIHGEKNYPFKKIASHLDIGLADGTGDDEYLIELTKAMKKIKEFNPDYIFYQMGVDPLIHDKLGTLSLTHEGLMKRDELVLAFCHDQEIPVSLALGGGYADPIEHSVVAYANTYRVVKKVYGEG